MKEPPMTLFLFFTPTGGVFTSAHCHECAIREILPLIQPHIEDGLLTGHCSEILLPIQEDLCNRWLSEDEIDYAFALAEGGVQ